jgi:hypothetical protein
LKELITGFSATIYPTLATQVIPGSLALSTWFMVAYQRLGQFTCLVDSKGAEATAGFVLAAALLGLVCEDLGSRWEVRCFNKQPEADRETQNSQWYAYLRTAFKTEPVGKRYLSSLVLRLKFDLNTPPALLIFAIGLLCSKTPGPWIIGGCAAALAVAWWLACVEVPETVKLTARVRAELLKSIRIVG